MAAVKKKKVKPGFWVTYIIAIVAMLCLFAVAMFKTFTVNKAYLAEKAELEDEIEQEEKRNAELSMEGDYYKSDEYYEKVAREKLGLVMPNEILFINQNK